MPLRRIHTQVFTWCLVLGILLVSAVIRYGLVDVPLERDEGEYAYAAQLLMNGIPPYKQMYNMKLPGIYVAYAGVMSLFGQNIRGIHLGLIAVNGVTIILLFLMGRRLMDPTAGVVAGASFAVLSMGQFVQGVFANAEHFLIMPVVGGLLLLVYALDDDRTWMLFIGGILLGLGFLVKQHGAAFIVFGAVYVLIEQVKKKPVVWPRLISRFALFFAGALLPYGTTCMILGLAGVFDKFWFWTVNYALSYTSQITTDRAWNAFSYRSGYIFRSASLIWMLAAFGLTALIWDKRARARWIFTLLFTLFSIMAICPGFYFRPHYFLLLLPAASILAGLGIGGVTKLLSSTNAKGLPALLAVVCLGFSVDQQRNFLFSMTPAEASRSTYGLNPFPESIVISRFIRAHTKEEDRIAVIGSEPQIYFYTHRRSASGYVYMYPLMEKHDFALRMQEEMIREIEASKPAFIIFVRIETSWLKRKDSPELLFEWLKDYGGKRYRLVGLVDLFFNGSRYYLGPSVRWPPRSPNWISLLKRIDGYDEKVGKDAES